MVIVGVDIGNTNTEIALIEVGTHRIIEDFRFSTNYRDTIDDVGVKIKTALSSIAGVSYNTCLISSVVPALNYAYKKAIERYIRVKAILLEREHIPIDVEYDNPYEIGIDRLVNTFASRELYGTPAIIVDFGTATTICYVNADGNYEGGIIIPGVLTSLNALSQKAAKLPQIDLEMPKQLIGKSTKQGMLSGIYNGSCAMINGLVEQIIKRYVIKNAFTIATGGFSDYLKEGLKSINIFDKYLTMKGLSLIYEHNKRAFD